MNPEFRRYVWLELTPLRLWALPLVVIALAVLANALGEPGPHGLNSNSLQSLGLWLFMVFAVWGGYKAAHSVTGEIVAGTWDQQRLAAHRPAELLFGKLFGSTVYDWLGVGCCLAVYALGSAFKSPPGAIALDLLILVLSALLLYTLALFSSLAAASGLRATRRPALGARQSATLIGLLLFGLWLSPAIFHSLSSGRGSAAQVHWWWDMSGSAFEALSLAMFLVWVLLGAHRLIRADLQEPVGPLPWIGFLAFLTAYFYPFVSTSLSYSSLGAFFTVAAAVCGVLYYPLLLGERKDVVRVRHLAEAWSRGDGRALWLRLPLWSFNQAGYWLAVAGLAVSTWVWPSSDGWGMLGVALSFGLFMGRDLGWILAVHLTPGLARRPDLVVLFFLAVFYGLVPALLAILGPSAESAMYLFLPGVSVVHAAEVSPVLDLFAILWALPGLAVAWAIAVPRLRRAVRSS